MTPEEIQEHREWSALKMGWASQPYQYGSILGNVRMSWVSIKDGEVIRECLYEEWQPDNSSTGQIWMFDDKMAKLGWFLELKRNERWPDEGKKFEAQYYHNEHGFVPDGMHGAEDDNPCVAIIKAAMATGALIHNQP